MGLESFEMLDLERTSRVCFVRFFDKSGLCLSELWVLAYEASLLAPVLEFGAVSLQFTRLLKPNISLSALWLRPSNVVCATLRSVADFEISMPFLIKLC